MARLKALLGRLRALWGQRRPSSRDHEGCSSISTCAPRRISRGMLPDEARRAAEESFGA